MFGLFKRVNNTVKNPKILLASIRAGHEQLFTQDCDIYQGQFNGIFNDTTEYRAANISEFFEFINGKTFDIVHLFADIETNGTIQDVSGTEFLKKLSASEVKVLIFASDNPGDNYVAFSKDIGKNIKPMNLVMTIERKGDLFPSFFKSLFGFMAFGHTMPMAWVELAPQNVNKTGSDTPGAIFSAGLGSLKFSS